MAFEGNEFIALTLQELTLSHLSIAHMPLAPIGAAQVEWVTSFLVEQLSLVMPV